MSDQGLKETASGSAAGWIIRGRTGAALQASEKVVSFIPQAGESSRPAEEPRQAAKSPRDWSTAIELIQEASEAIRISEERATELEGHLRQITAEASEEMRRLEAHIAAGEQRLLKAEERVRRAEARADEAEAWLVRLHDAVIGAFRRPPAMIAAEQPGTAVDAEETTTDQTSE
jgi:small-conductance mechanosensitive channel